MKNLLWLLNLTALLAAPVQAAGEVDILGQTETVRSERTVQTGGRVLWTLPFETTQYIPVQPTPAMKNALAAQQEGRFIEAISLLEQSGEEANLPDTQLLRAGFYLQGDQAAQAGNILSDLLKNNPQLAEAHALMAMVHLDEGRIDPAQAEIQKAQSLKSSPLVTRIATYVLQAQGKLEQASNAMAELNAKGPADPLNLAREAELALSLGERQRAAARADEALKLEPGSPYVMAVSGLVRLIEDRPLEAQQAFEIALKRDPEDAKALLGLGLATARQGKLEEGIVHLQEAARSEPSSALIQTYLGRALYQTGRKEEAQAAYRSAIKLDPQDPAPWIYLAQTQTESGEASAALASLKEAAVRKTARAVYRGENLLNEDEQTLQANIADAYRSLGLNDMAWLALTEGAGEKNAVNLKNGAEMLQGRRYAETARRSLALQSLFNDERDALPVSLDVYGDGAGQTGAQTPQHGAIEGLSGQQASYGDYGALFVTPTHVQIDGVAGNRQTWGEQLRVAIGNDRFGISLAERHYETEGFSQFNGLDNTTWQGVLKWDPFDSTRLFLSYQNFRSDRGETFFPAEPFLVTDALIEDKSWVARLGLRHHFDNGGELRALLSRQRVDQQVEYPVFAFAQPGESRADSGEVQYRQANSYGLFVAGFQKYREEAEFPGVTKNNIRARQIYAGQKFQLGEHWILDVGLGRAWLKNKDVAGLGSASTELRRWTPRLGLVFAPEPATHMRLALGQHLGLREVGGASLAPVETAGIVQVRPGDLDKLVRSAGMGFDHRLSSDWLLAGEVQLRRVWQPVAFLGAQTLNEFTQKDGELKLVWLPVDGHVTANLSAGYERRTSPATFFVLDSIDQQRLRDLKLSVSWFVDKRLSLKGEASRNWVDGDYQVFFPPSSFKDASTQINASLQWKLPMGLAEIGVRNLLDDDFEYTESDPLAPRFSEGRFVYGSARFSW